MVNDQILVTPPSRSATSVASGVLLEHKHRQLHALEPAKASLAIGTERLTSAFSLDHITAKVVPAHDSLLHSITHDAASPPATFVSSPLVRLSHLCSRLHLS